VSVNFDVQFMSFAGRDAEIGAGRGQNVPTEPIQFVCNGISLKEKLSAVASQTCSTGDVAIPEK
jgi:hypothetical protein